MQITYYGHACFAVTTGGKTLLFDPFITPNTRANQIDIDAIRCDYLLLTHAHQDHVADVERIMKNNEAATILAPYEVASHYGQQGFNHHPLNHGGKKAFDFGTVKLVNAVHSSSFGDGSYGGNAVGFVIWNEEGCFYNSGDTALTLDMQLIPMTCPPLDFAILSIGDNFTMGYEDAALAAEFVQADRVIGAHYDTFGYIEIDHEAAHSAFKDRGKTLILLSIGESRTL